MMEDLDEMDTIIGEGLSMTEKTRNFGDSEDEILVSNLGGSRNDGSFRSSYDILERKLRKEKSFI